MESGWLFSFDGAFHGGWRPVHEAAANNDLEAMKILLRGDPRNTDLFDVKNVFLGETSLVIAADNPATSPEMIKLLIDAGGDVNHVTNKGTPLQRAVIAGNLDIVRLLVAAGACVNGKLDPDGNTALHYAVDAKNVEMLRYFSDICDWRIVNVRNESALYCACCCNFTEGVELLLKYVDIKMMNKGDNRGDTPLDVAIYNDNKQIFGMLVVAGALVTSDNVEECLMCEGTEFLQVLLDTSLDTVLPLLYSQLFEVVQVDQLEYILKVLQNHEDCDKLERKMLDEIDLSSPLEYYSAFNTKLKVFFQYHFTYEPRDLFCKAVKVVHRIADLTSSHFIRVLSEIGVRGCWREKESFFRYYGVTEFIGKYAMAREEAWTNLEQPVLDLKRLSAMAARAHIRNYTGSNWMARLMVQESALPRICKQQLFLDFSAFPLKHSVLK